MQKEIRYSDRVFSNNSIKLIVRFVCRFNIIPG